MKPEQKNLWNKLLDAMKNDNISCHHYFAKLYTSKFPDRGAGWMALADVLSKMARYSEARDALKRAKLLCPKERLYIVFGGFGDLDMEKGDYLCAEKWYRKAIESRESVIDFNSLGVCLRNQGKFSEAKKCYKKALKISSDIPVEVYSNLGFILIAEKKYKEALNYFEKAIEIDPEWEPAKEAQRDIKNLLLIKKKANRRLKLV
jgi:tetratricopeptide (TPR) repeat protein